MKNKFIIAISVIGLAGLSTYLLPNKKVKPIAATPATTTAATKNTVEPINKSWINQQTKKITQQATNLNPTVLKVSLTAYAKARAKGMDEKQVLTVIDYSKPSDEPRLWVINMKTDQVIMNTWVAHGKNTGDRYAKRFSNAPHSLESSLGVFVTTSTYSGGHGYSLRIQGLEHGINDNVANRDVVFHGAWYAGGDVAKSRGMLGRSWGCMAVGQNVITPLVNDIKNNTIVVAYYPDQHWLQNSNWVNSVEA